MIFFWSHFQIQAPWVLKIFICSSFFLSLYASKMTTFVLWTEQDTFVHNLGLCCHISHHFLTFNRLNHQIYHNLYSQPDFETFTGTFWALAAQQNSLLTQPLLQRLCTGESLPDNRQHSKQVTRASSQRNASNHTSKRVCTYTHIYIDHANVYASVISLLLSVCPKKNRHNLW